MLAWSQIQSASLEPKALEFLADATLTRIARGFLLNIKLSVP